MGTSPLHVLSVATFIFGEDKKITDKKMKLKGTFYPALQEWPPGLRSVVCGNTHFHWSAGGNQPDRPRPGHDILSVIWSLTASEMGPEARPPSPLCSTRAGHSPLCLQAHLLGARRSTEEHCRGRNSTALPGRRWLDLHGQQALVCNHQNPRFPQRS